MHRETDRYVDLRSRNCNITETADETQLLKDDKRRLLGRPDWIGVAPSKPVSLQFLSSNEKEKIGKRRRTTRKINATQRQAVNNRSRREHLSLHDEIFDRTNQGLAPRNYLEDIRIRIGTDALTDTHPTQPQICAQSQASSESMLFEQNGLIAQDLPERPVLAPSVNSQRHAAASACEQDDALLYAYHTGEGAQHYHFVSHHAEHHPAGHSFEQEDCHSAPRELQLQSDKVTLETYESFVPGFRLTHRAHGEDCALHLVLGGLDSPAGSRRHSVPGSHEIGETQLPQTPEFAHASQTERVHHATIDDGGLDARVIIDEDPWTKYLPISDGSSSPSDTAVYTRNSVLHNHPTTKNSSGAATDWSQHAAQGQGDQSRFGHSSISASLPSLRCGVGTSMPAHASGMEVIRQSRWNPTNVRALDEEEKNWQAFILGSDNASSLQATHKHAGRSSPLISKYSENASSGYLPLSVAVSSVSPPPLIAGPRFASYVHEDTQDPADSALASHSCNTSRRTFRRCVEKLDEGMLERKAVDGQSVTHASLQNNASSEPISSRIFSRTTTVPRESGAIRDYTRRILRLEYN